MSGDKVLFCKSGEDAVSLTAEGELGDHNSREHSETQRSGSGVMLFNSGEEQMSFSSENGVVFLVSANRLELSGLLTDRQSGDCAIGFISVGKMLHVIPLISGDSVITLLSDDTTLYVKPVIWGDVVGLLLRGEGVLLVNSGDRFLLLSCVVMLISGVSVILLESSGEGAWPEWGELDMPLVSVEELLLIFSAGEGVALGSSE